jgi:hypothetical protein
MKTKTVFILISAILLIAGCTLGKGNYDIQSLTTGEKRLVKAELEYFDILYPLMSGLAQASSASSLFDIDGNTGSSAYLNDLQDAKRELWSFYNNDQIVSGVKDGAVCFYLESYDWEEVIGISQNQLSYGLMPLCLAHEGIHSLDVYHEATLENWIDANNNHPYNPDFFDKIQQYKDVPYLTDVFWGISHELYNIYLELMDSCDAASDSAGLDIEQYMPESCSDWNEEMRETLSEGDNPSEEWKDIFSELGLTDTEIEDWIDDSGLCEDLIDYCESL